jgi:hypothetical protein
MQTQAAIWTKQDIIYTSVHGATVRKVNRWADPAAATYGEWVWRAGSSAGYAHTLKEAKSCCEQVRRGWR